MLQKFFYAIEFESLGKVYMLFASNVLQYNSPVIKTIF